MGKPSVLTSGTFGAGAAREHHRPSSRRVLHGSIGDGPSQSLRSSNKRRPMRIDRETTVHHEGRRFETTRDERALN
jgi:hypothetical protein